VISRDWPNFGSSSWRSNLREEVNIGLVVLTPFARKIVFVVNSLYWANRLASSAVHALIRVDVKHAVALVNAVNWALIDTGFVFDIDARKCNHVSHITPKKTSDSKVLKL
jgi:hypothetical protein